MAWRTERTMTPLRGGPNDPAPDWQSVGGTTDKDTFLYEELDPVTSEEMNLYGVRRSKNRPKVSIEELMEELQDRGSNEILSPTSLRRVATPMQVRRLADLAVNQSMLDKAEQSFRAGGGGGMLPNEDIGAPEPLDWREQQMLEQEARRSFQRSQASEYRRLTGGSVGGGRSSGGAGGAGLDPLALQRQGMIAKALFGGAEGKLMGMAAGDAGSRWLTEQFYSQREKEAKADFDRQKFIAEQAQRQDKQDADQQWQIIQGLQDRASKAQGPTEKAHWQAIGSAYIKAIRPELRPMLDPLVQGTMFSQEADKLRQFTQLNPEPTLVPLAQDQSNLHQHAASLFQTHSWKVARDREVFGINSPMPTVLPLAGQEESTRTYTDKDGKVQTMVAKVGRLAFRDQNGNIKILNEDQLRVQETADALGIKPAELIGQGFTIPGTTYTTNVNGVEEQVETRTNLGATYVGGNLVETSQPKPVQGARISYERPVKVTRKADGGQFVPGLGDITSYQVKDGNDWEAARFKMAEAESAAAQLFLRDANRDAPGDAETDNKQRKALMQQAWAGLRAPEKELITEYASHVAQLLEAHVGVKAPSGWLTGAGGLLGSLVGLFTGGSAKAKAIKAIVGGIIGAKGTSMATNKGLDWTNSGASADEIAAFLESDTFELEMNNRFYVPRFGKPFMSRQGSMGTWSMGPMRRAYDKRTGRFALVYAQQEGEAPGLNDKIIFANPKLGAMSRDQLYKSADFEMTAPLTEDSFKWLWPREPSATQRRNDIGTPVFLGSRG